MTSTSPAQARTTLALVRDPVFGPYLLGRLLSSFALWIHNVVVVVLAYDIHHSTLDSGAVTTAQWLPQFVFAPLCGRWADAGDPRRQIVIGRLVAAGGSAWLAGVCLAPGNASDRLPILVMASALVGIGGVIGASAMQAVLVEIVDRSDLARAVNLNNLPFTVSRAVGPVLAVGLLAIGPGAAFAAAALGQASLAVIMLRIRSRMADRAPRPESDIRMLAALRYLRGERRLARLLLGVGVLGVAADPSLTLAPAIASRLGAGDEFAGWCAGSLGLGSGAGLALVGVLALSVRADLLGCLGCAGMAVGLIATACTNEPYLVLAGFSFCGVGMAVGLAGLSTLIQIGSPDALRGRIMALWGMAFLGSRPIAAACGSALAGMLGVGGALGVFGAVAATCAWVVRPSSACPIPPSGQTI